MADDIVVIDTEEEETVVDNGTSFVSSESAEVAEQAAREAKLWAEESERQALLAIGSAEDAAQAKDDAVAAKEYAEAAATDANVVAVGTDLRATPSNIKTVASNISDVTTVAGISSNVTTVAGNTTNINTVAGVSSNVTTVATNSANITAVANNATNINAVNANKTNIDKVAGDINRVNLVADDIASVHTVAVDISTIIDVANNKTNIDAVSGNETNITAVANNATNINAVNANKTNIDAVAGNNTDISAVAADLTNIDAVAADLTNIDNASANAQLARDWAVKMDGLVGNTDYSSKYYAQQAQASAASVDNTNIVHKTGDETINGHKTFKQSLINQKDNITKGTAPSSNTYNPVLNCTDTNNKRMGMVELGYFTDKQVKMTIGAYNGNTSSDGDGGVYLELWNNNGTGYVKCPASDVNGSIVTTIDKYKDLLGYFKFGNGLIVQWGYVNGGTATTGNVTFPTAFSSNTGVRVVACSNQANVNISVGGESPTGFTWGKSSSSAYIKWIAVGF